MKENKNGPNVANLPLFFVHDLWIRPSSLIHPTGNEMNDTK